MKCIHKHYCPEWDYMLISSNDPEYQACLCDCYYERKQTMSAPKLSGFMYEELFEDGSFSFETKLQECSNARIGEIIKELLLFMEQRDL